MAEPSTWGAPRILGKLKMIGLDISERTVLRWMRKAPRNLETAKRWAAFLRSHSEAIAAKFKTQVYFVPGWKCDKAHLPKLRLHRILSVGP